MKRITLLITAIMLAGIPHAPATIINIPGDYPTIQQGIDATVDGDTVLVQPGTYVENINFGGHDIVVASLFLTTQDTSYISSTIIDGNESGTVITFENGEDESAKLTGLTITNGLSPEGGGIYLANGSNPAISDNRIIFNFSEYDFSHGYGGGIYCTNSDPLITRNLIYENDANYWGWGGGIYLISSNATISENRIIDNRSGFGGGICCRYNSVPIISGNLIEDNFAIYGGGIRISSYCNAQLNENTISENYAVDGGGIFIYEAEPQITNNVLCANDAISSGGGIYIERYCSPFISGNLIYDNTADLFGAGIYSVLATPHLINNTIVFNSSGYEGGGFYSGHYDPTLRNNIIWGNEPHQISVIMGSPQVTYCDVEGGWEGEGNIDCDPQFCDPENGDYHLHLNSCCVGAGEDGFDIGALGIRCGIPCDDYVIGDFNGSAAFNVGDIVDAYSKLKTGQPDAALICECPPESGNDWEAAMDLNNSCSFNAADVADGYSYLKTGSPELMPCELCPPGGL